MLAKTEFLFFSFFLFRKALDRGNGYDGSYGSRIRSIGMFQSELLKLVYRVFHILCFSVCCDTARSVW